MKDLFDFIKARKKFVLVPVILVLLLLAMLSIFASSTALAPLVYSFF